MIEHVVQTPSTKPMFATLIDALEHWASSRPDAPALTHLSYMQEERYATTLSYGELWDQVSIVEADIRAVTRRDDRVLILTRHGIDYAVAFLACLRSRRVAVPLFPVERPSQADRLSAVLDDSRPAASCVSGGDDRTVSTLGSRLGTVVFVDGAKPLPRAVEHVGSTQDISPDHVAYLQYTSGSTRSPAGVMVTDRNVVSQLNQIRECYPVVDELPVVNWLPLFHDMGLVFSLALPLYCGVHAVTMAPMDFVKRPERWLAALSDYGAGATASPNFGLEMAASAYDRNRHRVDLSSLRVLMNGSEPIRAPSLRLFTNAFRDAGFDPAAHSAAYGLAEATLVVTASEQDSGTVVATFDRGALGIGRAVIVGPNADGGVEIVGCGTPRGQDLVIVDPINGSVCSERTVGEVVVAGPNVCAGYFGHAESEDGDFQRTVSGTSQPDEPMWLRTGDVGFISDGVLFVTARTKDLIIVDGRNHYPMDIETTVAAAATELRAGHVVAFAADRGEGESVVIVAEVDRAHEHSVDTVDVVRRIRGAVTAVHEIVPADVLLVAAGTIPKTTSGKLQRAASARCHDDGEFVPLMQR
jgi:acyl-CoA synthetase (AMP-forming)/AMP-acid ligase II